MNWDVKTDVFADKKGNRLGGNIFVDKKGSFLGLPGRRRPGRLKRWRGGRKLHILVMSEQDVSGYGDEMRYWTAAWFAASLAKDLDPTGGVETL